MALFGGTSRPLPGRGPSTGLRFTIYAMISVVLMFLDQRGGWLNYARYALSAAAYPIQLAVNSPSAAWAWVAESFEARTALQAENAALQKKTRALELRTLRFEALSRENAQLRGLRKALPGVVERWLPGEIVNVELSTLRQRVLVNRGERNGVFRRQAVVAEGGLMGQVIRVGPWSSEVILVSDPEHAVPVQVLRSGLRTIAVGQGNTGVMILPYLPINSDITAGDLLVTSGLGGVFPAGYPVASVVDVARDPGQPLAQVRAEISAKIERDREVVFVWFTPGHPAAPIADPDAPPRDDLAATPLPASETVAPAEVVEE